ncbi:MAG: hypothetical protein ABJ004_07935 [Cyclobacteriaceae bacterium]
MIRFSIFFLGLVALQVSLLGQGNLLDDMAGHEDKLRADTKQVNQFFRRFNGEEDRDGNRLYEDNRQYRSRKIRQDYLPYLFDLQSSISSDLKEEFIDEMTDRKNPAFLNFHENGWFAEVATDFTYKGKKSRLILFMELQPQGQGYEWVIADVLFDPFKNSFSKDTTSSKPFIHPMSHELDFMNLRKAFQGEHNPESYTKDSFEPDYVSLFLYELKNTNLKFQTVTNVKFHFFSPEGWYFELAKYNRPGMNSGWLITNLVRINTNQEKQLKAFIYDK